MSLDKFRAQAYAPIRLQANQLAGFFDSLRNRKFVRDDDDGNSVKLSDKPFEAPEHSQVDAGMLDLESKSTSKQKQSDSKKKTYGVQNNQTIKKTTKKKKAASSKLTKSQRAGLEALLKSAKL